MHTCALLPHISEPQSERFLYTREQLSSVTVVVANNMEYIVYSPGFISAFTAKPITADHSHGAPVTVTCPSSWSNGTSKDSSEYFYYTYNDPQAPILGYPQPAKNLPNGCVNATCEVVRLLPITCRRSSRKSTDGQPTVQNLASSPGPSRDIFSGPSSKVKSDCSGVNNQRPVSFSEHQ